MPPTEKSFPHKYEELAHILKEKILRLASGTRLPSVRSLMKRYNLSLQTVNAALKKLEIENLIITKRGSGIYVSDQRTVKLIVLHRSVAPSLYEDAKEACIRQSVVESGWYLETRRHEVASKEIHHPFAPEPKACAHLVTQDLANLRFGLLNQLLQQNVPLVVLGRETDTFHVDYVTTNDQQILRVLVKHLRSLGHTRLALLVNEPSSYFEIKRRIEYFNETIELMDLPSGLVIDCNVQPGEKTTRAAYFGLKRFLEELPHGADLPFTGLIVTSTTGGSAALRVFHEKGIRVPQQCSLASFEAEDKNEFSIPSITDAGTPIGLWGPWVVRALQQRFSGDPTPSLGYKLPVELFARESTSQFGLETSTGPVGPLG